MRHAEHVALIRAAIPPQDAPAPTWADFGAGRGAFTQALRDLLGDGATILAVDRDAGALRAQSTTVQTVTGDFTRPLDIPPLDGLLVANALHFVADQRAAMTRLAAYLKPGGRFVVVEYDVNRPRGYIPHPLPYARFVTLAQQIGLTDPFRTGERRSPSSGTVMYAAAARKAAAS